MTLKEELQAIHNKYGKLTPELVVEEARQKDHPLHHRIFDRPVKEAAEAWYLHRADELIKKVKVKKTLPNGELVTLRAFSPVRAEAGVYDPLEAIMEDPVAMAVLLKRMEREWREMFTRYRHLQQFIEMVRKDLAA